MKYNGDNRDQTVRFSKTGNILGTLQIPFFSVLFPYPAPLFLILHPFFVKNPYRHGKVGITLYFQNYPQWFPFDCNFLHYITGDFCCMYLVGCVMDSEGTICFFMDIFRENNRFSMIPFRIQQISKTPGIFQGFLLSLPDRSSQIRLKDILFPCSGSPCIRNLPA